VASEVCLVRHVKGDQLWGEGNRGELQISNTTEIPVW
jgi:hypothetical protein